MQPQENEELGRCIHCVSGLSRKELISFSLSVSEEINAEKKQSLKALKEDIHRMGDEAVALAEQNVARELIDASDFEGMV